MMCHLRKQLPVYLSLLLSLVVYLAIAQKFGFPEKVKFDGDSWEYHTIAVNLLYGHGYRPGIIEPFESYFCYVTSGTTPWQWDTYGEMFYRTPGYPLMLAFSYAVFGLKGSSLWMVQYVLFSVVVGFIPLLYHRCFKLGWAGYLAGVMSVVFIFKRQYFYVLNVAEVYTEVIQMVGLFVFICAFYRMTAHQHKSTSYVWLGLSCGLNLLIKGAFIFVPPMVLLAVACLANSWKHAFFRCLIFGGSMLLLIAPWSTYATLKSGTFVALSTQGSVVFLDGNNEKSLKTGAWEPGYTIYENERYHGMGNVEKVVYFYMDHIHEIPKFLQRKLNNIFYDLPNGTLLTLTLIFLMLSILMTSSGLVRVYSLFLIVFVAWMTMAHFYFPQKNGLGILILMPCLYLLKRQGRPLLEIWLKPSEAMLSIWILTANIFLLTLVLFGIRRFFAPYHVFILPLNYLVPIYGVMFLFKNLKKPASTV